MKKNVTLSALLVFSAMVSSVALPAWAVPVTYFETDGKESINLDLEGLSILENIGLTFVSSENTAAPAPGFTYGWALLPPSRFPGVRGTDFSFSYDADTDVYIPLAGTEEFSGTLLFEVDPTKLGLGSQLIVGDLSASFNDRFEFSAVDTATTNLRLFDVKSSGAPVIDVESQSWFLENIEILATQEFSDFLTAAGAERSITGTRIGTVRGDRIFLPENNAAKSVPEPTSLIGLLGLSGWLLAGLKRLRA